MKDDNTLFNQSRMDSYLKKYKKEFKLTNAQKEAVIKWNKKLKDGELKKEESNYTNFAINILVNLLGYDPDTDFEQEVKMGRGFADFVIKKDGKNFIVGELKGSDADLDKRQPGRLGEMSAVEQGFFYANKEGIKWIIVSNYNEFRLYNRNIGEDKFIKFKIDELKDDHEKLKSFLLTFSKFSILEKKLIDKLASKTQFVDREFENEFYKLYNETRLMLIAEIEHLHSDFTRDKSVKYAQLILNRYIFVCFAEDIGLLPGEISVETIENATKNKSSLGRNGIWYSLNNLFLDINEGNEENEVREYEIFGYNGGLFSKDLGFLKIRDFIDDHSIFEDTYQNWNFKEYYSIVENKLGSAITKINPIYKNLMTISTFNFKSEVDVNILGHIFENSIGDIEELKADSKGRRKKDGIFYTPEYITDYICRNTIIPYLSEKNSKTVEELIIEYVEKIDELENKLMNIKIIDPACGSGAFLNKASDILLEIHNAIYDYKKEIERVTIKTKGGKGKSKIKTDAEHIKLDSYFDKAKNRRKILKNNIYGVDLNEESVDITKLALFLKIAQKDKKLPHIDKNIKCGNSLIDNPKYTDKPFNWEDEFKEIFDNGGFDIVIGNPPYVRQERIKEIKPFLKENYETYTGIADLYVYFFEKGLKIIKNKGMMAYICSNKFIKANYGKKLRSHIISNSKFYVYVDHTHDNIFEDASAYPSVFILKKELPTDTDKIFVNNEFEIEQNRLSVDSWGFEKPEILDLRDKIDSLGLKIKEIEDVNIYRGILTGFNDAFVIDNDMKEHLIEQDYKNKDIIKPIVRGKDIKRWLIDYKDLYLLYIPWDFKIDEYPSIKKYLLTHEESLKKRPEVKAGRFNWYALSRYASDYIDNFEKPKLIYPNIASRLFATYDNNSFYTLDTAYFIVSENISIKYLGALLSSKTLNFRFKFLGTPLRGNYYKLSKVFFEELPIFIASNEEQMTIIKEVDCLLQLKNNLLIEMSSFKRWLKINFEIEKLSLNLEDYSMLTFNEFLLELKKKKINVNPRDVFNLLEVEFNRSLNQINPLKNEIKKIEENIDQMVYELYGLTEDEIDIIENSLKN